MNEEAIKELEARKAKASEAQSRVDRMLQTYQAVCRSDEINPDDVKVVWFDEIGEAELRLGFE
jgi:hypothetical protein